ncbi:hypothetical protein M2266_004991 [Streptomyces sp. SPB162]|nr:hypothetical protein [Streptomyces sp. SPB162]
MRTSSAPLLAAEAEAAAKTCRVAPATTASPCQGRPTGTTPASRLSSALVIRSVTSAAPEVFIGKCAQYPVSFAAARCGIRPSSTADRVGRVCPSGARITSRATVRACSGSVQALDSITSTVLGALPVPTGLSDRWDRPKGGAGPRDAGARL